MAAGMLNDFSNSQKQDVVLKNRMQDLGKSPTISQAERTKYDGSLLDRLGEQGVNQAKEDAQNVRQNFDEDMRMRQYDDGQKLKDPNSQESIEARQYLARVVPSVAKNPNFNTMSAEQLQRVTPMIMEKWRADRAQANADREYGLKARELAVKGSEKKKLSGEEQKRLDSAGMALAGVQGMRQALAKGDNTFSVVGDNDFTVWRRDFEEGLGRMQSGGAITKDEEDRFKEMAPTKWDSAEMQQRKLNKLEAEMSARIRGLGANPESSLAERGVKEYKQAPHGQRVKQNGVIFVWDGSDYQPE
jgi:hypothetical protein